MTWKNAQFGEFEYMEDHVILFPEGLIGFEDLHKYILINEEETQPFLWLVSLEDPLISFPLLNPRGFLGVYPEPDTLGASDAVFVIATLQDNPAESAVNLKSPIVINNATRQAKQIILENERYGFHHQLFPATTESRRV